MDWSLKGYYLKAGLKKSGKIYIGPLIQTPDFSQVGRTFPKSAGLLKSQQRNGLVRLKGLIQKPDFNSGKFPEVGVNHGGQLEMYHSVAFQAGRVLCGICAV